MHNINSLMKKIKLKKIVCFVFVIICLIIFCYSAINIIIWFLDTKHNEDLNKLEMEEINKNSDLYSK